MTCKLDIHSRKQIFSVLSQRCVAFNALTLSPWTYFPWSVSAILITQPRSPATCHGHMPGAELTTNSRPARPLAGLSDSGVSPSLPSFSYRRQRMAPCSGCLRRASWKSNAPIYVKGLCKPGSNKYSSGKVENSKVTSSWILSPAVLDSQRRCK
jgi:hypothetical protein